MAIRKRGEYYWTDISFGGKRIRKSLKTSDKRKAMEYHDKLKASLWDSRFANSEHTWDEAIVRWLKEKGYKKSLHKDRSMISYFDKVFKGKKLVECDLTRALDNKGDEVTGTTLNRYKAFLRSLFRRAKFEWGWAVKLPRFTLQREKPRERHLTETEFETLLWNLPDSLRNIVTFAVETGLRRSNILDIDKSCVDVVTNTLYLESKYMKSGKPLSIPLSPRAMMCLMNEGYKFKFTDSDYLKFKKAANRSGIMELRFHDLRHTFATWKAQDGVPIEVLSKLLGHSDIKTTDRYRHLNVEDLRRYVCNHEGA